MKIYQIVILLLLTYSSHAQKSAPKSIHISGHIDPTFRQKMKGSLQFRLHREMFTGADPMLNQVYPIKMQVDSFHLDIRPTAAYIYLEPLFGSAALMGRRFLIQPGTSFQLIIDAKQQVSISGSPLMDCQLTLNRELQANQAFALTADTMELKQEQAVYAQKLDAILSGYQEKLDAQTLALLRLNYLSEAGNRVFRRHKQNVLDPSDVYHPLRAYLAKNFGRKEPEIADFLIRYSAPYIQYRNERQQILSMMRKLQHPDSSIFKISYHDIQKTTSGLLRDKLLTFFFVRSFSSDTDANRLLTQTLPQIRDSLCRNILQALQRSKSSGQPAYAFRLEDQKGQIHQLADFKGKVLICKFWFTGCTPCRQLEKTLHPLKEKYKDNPNLVFVSINVDLRKDLWIRSLATGEYSSESDLNLSTYGKGTNHEMLAFYHYAGFPQLLLIDKDGKIITSSPKRPQDKVSLNAFKSLFKKYL